MPDSFTFGCPAPRLGLDLASLSSVLARDAGFAQLRLCSHVEPRLSVVSTTLQSLEEDPEG